MTDFVRDTAVQQLGKWWTADEVAVAMDTFEEQGLMPKLHTVLAPHNNTRAIIEPLQWTSTDARRADGSGGYVYNPTYVQVVFTVAVALIPMPGLEEGWDDDLITIRVQMNLVEENSEFVFRNLDQICENPPDPQKLKDPIIPKGWIRRSLQKAQPLPPLAVDSWLPWA